VCAFTHTHRNTHTHTHTHTHEGHTCAAAATATATACFAAWASSWFVSFKLFPQTLKEAFVANVETIPSKVYKLLLFPRNVRVPTQLVVRRAELWVSDLGLDRRTRAHK
jgi:hypothetical protein